MYENSGRHIGFTLQNNSITLRLLVLSVILVGFPGGVDVFDLFLYWPATP